MGERTSWHDFSDLNTPGVAWHQSMPIIDRYMALYERYARQYDRVYLAYMVGKFYESYARTSDELATMRRVCDQVNLSVSKIQTEGRHHWMAGFPVSDFRKWMCRLVRLGYTVVRYDQRDDPVDPRRKQRVLHQIYSPATCLDDCFDDTTWLLVLAIERIQTQSRETCHAVGVCLMDLTRDASVLLHERVVVPRSNQNIEELRDIVATHGPKEAVIVVESMEKDDSYLQRLIGWLGMSCPLHIQKAENLPVEVTRASLQAATLQRVYQDTLPDECLVGRFNLARRPRARLAFVRALHFVERHNASLLDRLREPRDYRSDRFMTTDYVIERLQVFAPQQQHRFGSCFRLLARFATTACGRRGLRRRLSQPLCRADDIEAYYQQIDRLLEDRSSIDRYRQLLTDIGDLDRLYRRMQVKRLSPGGLATIHASHRSLLRLVDTMPQAVRKVFDVQDSWIECLRRWCDDVERRFYIENLANVGLVRIEKELFRPGHHPLVDGLMERRKGIGQWMERLVAVACRAVDPKQPDRKVTLQHTDRDGHYLQMTRLRFKAFQKTKTLVVKTIASDRDHDPSEQGEYVPDAANDGGTCIGVDSIDVADFKVDKSRTNYVRLRGSALGRESERLTLLNQRYRVECRQAFQRYLDESFRCHERMFQDTIERLTAIDVALAAACAARQYRYCRPAIERHETDDSIATFDVEELRHPLSERAQTDVNFVHYTFRLDAKQRGMIMTSPNGSGKSILLKSTGLAIYLAQCGFYVPAKSLRFRPFHHLGCRAGHHDDLLLGESTYTSEMKELQRMLEPANHRSLLLLDEVAASTEVESATGLQVATIDYMCRRGTAFLFATHVRGLERQPYVTKCPQVAFYHMRTEYCDRTDCFQYCYELVPGVETRLYGLEVLGSIVRDQRLKTIAREVRDACALDRQPVDRPRLSRYCSQVATIRCAICHDPGVAEPLDTHHIVGQCTANNGTVLHSTPVHQRSNLVTLCKRHHQAVHGKGPGPYIEIHRWIKTSVGRTLLWNERNDRSDQRNERSDQRNNRSDQRNNRSDQRNNRSDQRNNRSDQRNNRSDQRNDRSDQRNERSDQRNNRSDQRNNRSDQRNDRFDQRNERSDQRNNRSDQRNERSDQRNNRSDQRNDRSDEPPSKPDSTHAPDNIAITLQSLDRAATACVRARAWKSDVAETSCPDNMQGVSIPAELIPAELIPAVLIPAELIPAVLIPAELIPAELIPAVLIPAVLIPAVLIPAVLIPAVLISAVLIPAELIPAELIPAVLIPAVLISAVLIPAELIPAELIPAVLIPAVLISAVLIPAELIPAELIPAVLIPAVLISAVLIPAELIPAELIPAVLIPAVLIPAVLIPAELIPVVLIPAVQRSLVNHIGGGDESASIAASCFLVST